MSVNSDSKYGVDLSRLCSASQQARLVMRWQRERRRFMVRQGAGSNWSEEASREKIHVNLISLYKKIILRQLAPQTLRVDLTSFDISQRPTIKAAESWFCEELKKIHFTHTLERVIHDALYGFGIMKVGIATPSISALRAYNIEAGEPYASRVDFDDWVWDIHARDPHDCYFKGHRFRVPLDTIRDDSRYSKARKDLQASTDPRFNPEGDERIDVLGRGYYGDDEEVQDMVDLWEFYLPCANNGRGLIITLPHDSLTGVTSPSHGGVPVALLEEEYIGPDDGPYRILGFEDVPGNLSPKGPIQDLLELHLPLNNIMRKLIRQAERMKENTFIGKRQAGDEGRIRDAMDGDIVPVDEPEKVQVKIQGGPNQMLFQFFLQVKEIYSWVAGNLDVSGGLSPQGKTLGQEKILNANASGGIGDMQDRTMVFMKDSLSSLLWYYWHHPFKKMESVYAPPNLPEFQIKRTVHPWNHPDPNALKRNGNWEDISMNLHPIQNLTPQERSQNLKALLMQIWAPLQQQAGQSGVVPNFPKIFETLGLYDNDPAYAELFQVQEPQVDDAAGGGGGEAGPQMGPQETVHTRMNVPTRTPEGTAQNLITSLAGVDPGGSQNGHQMTLLGRP